MWTRNLTAIPAFSYQKLEEHQIFTSEKTSQRKVDIDTKKDKKGGYRLFKAGFTTQIKVKSNVKKGNDTVYFLVRCQVSAQMQGEKSTYVHFDQTSGNIVFAKCQCPAGAGGHCKHVAALLFQLLDYIELGLTEIPDDKTCTQELQQWHVPKKSEPQDAVLFEDLISPQDSYEKDKHGSKCPIVEGRRQIYSSTSEKVSKSDLEKLKVGLETAGSNCPVIGLLTDNDCIPCEFDVNTLPSWQRMINAEAEGSKLRATNIRQNILARLNGKPDYCTVPVEPKCTKFVKDGLQVEHKSCKEIEKNTRTQSDCLEWYAQRRCRLTSIFGLVMKRLYTQRA